MDSERTWNCTTTLRTVRRWLASNPQRLSPNKDSNGNHERSLCGLGTGNKRCQNENYAHRKAESTHQKRNAKETRRRYLDREGISLPRAHHQQPRQSTQRCAEEAIKGRNHNKSTLQVEKWKSRTPVMPRTLADLHTIANTICSSHLCNLRTNRSMQKWPRPTGQKLNP